jgi:hypothetical protein
MRWSNIEHHGERMFRRLDNQDSCSGFNSPAALLDGLFEQPAGVLSRYATREASETLRHDRFDLSAFYT